MAVKRKKKSNGTNVRLSDGKFLLIKKFVTERGYRIGAFVENAALEKIGREKLK